MRLPPPFAHVALWAAVAVAWTVASRDHHPTLLLDALTDEDIERAMREDPDWADHIDVNWADAEMVYPVAKKALSIRLDKDVIDFFQAQGRGYQTRINQALRDYMTMEARKRA